MENIISVFTRLLKSSISEDGVFPHIMVIDGESGRQIAAISSNAPFDEIVSMVSNTENCTSVIFGIDNTARPCFGIDSDFVQVFYVSADEAKFGYLQYESGKFKEESISWGHEIYEELYKSLLKKISNIIKRDSPQTAGLASAE